MGHVNIIVAGKTGVGKSTLVNAVFGQKIANTGTGRPVTQELKEITVPNYPLRIYDTVGLELNKDQQIRVKNDIINLISEKRHSGNIDSQIHCIWYCVSGTSGRFEIEEENFVKSLAGESGVPVIVVVTQAISKKAKDLQKCIDEMNLPIHKSFCVLAEDYEIDEDYTKKAYGCDRLVDYVTEILPESAQKAFINAQVASLKAKRKKAQFVILGASTVAFGEGFIPLPFADAAALIPTEISMIATITTIYGMDIKKSTITAIVSSLLGSTIATIAGKTIVANLLKAIPYFGTLAGGSISGGTATVLTLALGEIYIGIMEKMMKGEITEQQLENKKYLNNYIEKFKDNMKNADKIKDKYEVSTQKSL
ncbi:MAG: DUF697 domain-containing protein [Ruminococcus sp.]|nr:DUF697 domain-containing protein [Ruminococcus sp.]